MKSESGGYKLWVLFLVFSGTLINAIDRSSLATANTFIAKDLHLDMGTMGIVLSVTPEGGDSRDGIKKKILKIKDYQGVSGNITFSGNDAERSFYYLTVNRGVIEEVTGH